MSDENIEITVLYDDKILDEDLYPDWGVSIHVKIEDKDILFDVGHDENILQHNMEQLGISKEDIDIIVVSHRHWDHFNGLSLFKDQDVKIFVPSSLIQRIEKEFDLKGDLMAVTEGEKIVENVYTTGELGKAIKEQSLLVEGKDGINIITGCGHPGIGNIIEKASELGRVNSVIGGYHGFSDLDVLEDISVLVPCHCTMLLDKIKERYPKKYRECGVGFRMDI